MGSQKEEKRKEDFWLPWKTCFNSAMGLSLKPWKKKEKEKTKKRQRQRKEKERKGKERKRKGKGKKVKGENPLSACNKMVFACMNRSHSSLKSHTGNKLFWTGCIKAHCWCVWVKDEAGLAVCGPWELSGPQLTSPMSLAFSGSWNISWNSDTALSYGKWRLKLTLRCSPHNLTALTTFFHWITPSSKEISRKNVG